MSYIDTEKVSLHLREKAIDPTNRKILITNFHHTDQETDLTEPANCKGFGRVRHFKLDSGSGWPLNPLPIVPAARVLGIPQGSEMRAQVFQNSVCNWRCWYCFVDFKLLSGNKTHSEYLSCDELLDLYLDQDEPPSIIDLSGGQPDLTPEWVPWMIEALQARGLDDKTYLWSDDNLSNDYFWRYLSPAQIDTIQRYGKYARVCCFKGIDPPSFSENTNADPALFTNQFELVRRLKELKIDLYFYITLTSNTTTDFSSVIPAFMDRAQKIHENLPLRIVPLQIFPFTPVKPRMNATTEDLLKGQSMAIEVWENELQRRFKTSLREKSIADIDIY